jgi:hypothetical protein
MEGHDIEADKVASLITQRKKAGLSAGRPARSGFETI